MDKRSISLRKYGISAKRYKELTGFCEQYPEWKEKLEEIDNPFKGIEYTGMPIYHTNSDTTSKLAIKRSELSSKCDLIESTAKQASKDLSMYIIRSVCYGDSVKHLIAYYNMPCSPASFYDVRRYFFCLLNENKK